MVTEEVVRELVELYEEYLDDISRYQDPKLIAAVDASWDKRFADAVSELDEEDAWDLYVMASSYGEQPLPGAESLADYHRLSSLLTRAFDYLRPGFTEHEAAIAEAQLERLRRRLGFYD